MSAGLLLAATGCEVDSTDDGIEAQSLTVFEDSQIDDASSPWTSGQTIRIEMDGGDLTVVEGTADEVSARFQGVVTRGFEEADAAEAELEALTKEIIERDGKLVVSVDAPDGASNTLGANTLVRLPANFDGVLELTNAEGTVDIQFTGQAARLSLFKDGAGPLQVTVTSIVVPTGGDHLIENEAGSIVANFPETSEPFSIRAGTTDEEVNVFGLPSYCAAVDGEIDPPGSEETLVCNDGTNADAVYQLNTTESLLGAIEINL